MKFVIKEKEHLYEPDFPEGWTSTQDVSVKYPVQIGHHTCFIKRFERAHPEAIAGWELLTKLKHRYETNLARVYDVVRAEERGQLVCYVVYEYLKGSLLHDLIGQHTAVDLEKATADLFQALSSLQTYGYWFPELAEENIFLDNNGRFLLVNLDRAQPLARSPHPGLFANKTYRSLVNTFYEKILQYTQPKVAELNGQSLNHLQLLFLIERLKLSYHAREQRYSFADTYDGLPEKLDQIDPVFRTLFTALYENKNAPPYAGQAEEIQKLIQHKIIHYYPRLPVSGTPVIEQFTVNLSQVQKGESFELHWKVRDASAIELYKNGKLDERFGPHDSHIKRRAGYESSVKEITFKLVAIRGDRQAESEPLHVHIVEARPVVPKAPARPAAIKQSKEPQPKEEAPHTGRLKQGMLIGGSVLALAALGLFLFSALRSQPEKKKPKIDGLHPRYIFNPGELLVITGKNFPVGKEFFQIILNGVPALIQKRTPDSVVVMYPLDGDQSIWKGSVSVGMIINRDTLFSPNQVIVLKNLAGVPDDKPSPAADTLTRIPK